MMLSDAQIVALTLWGEARGEPVEGRIAVACVIRNRVREPGWWGDSYMSVCLAKQQFSCWNADDPNYSKLMALSNHMLRGESVDAILDECLWVAEGIVGGRVRDRVGAATHYYAESIQAPKWAKGATLVGRVGHHLFFQGVK